VNIDDELGHDGCYVVLRKLGYGVYSNVWLARDKRLVDPVLLTFFFPRPCQRFVAIKILTTNATKGLRAGHMDEHAFLKRISEPAEYFEEGREHCLTLLDSFDIVREDDSGSFHCLVTEVLGKTLVHVCREYLKRIIPLPLLTTVLRHILHALNYLHVECDIIHTGTGSILCIFETSFICMKISKQTT
jgi:serine/threonine-protein kinase SRPK3